MARGGSGAEPPGEHLILKASAAPQNLHAGKYFEFTVTPGIGTVLNLNSAAFRMYSEWDGTGTAGWAIRSSVDGFANNIGNTTLTTGADWGVGTVNFPGTGYDNLNSLTLRVYPWADSGSPVRYDNASLEVAAVPEPVTIALVCFGLVLGSFKVLRFWRSPRRVRIKRLLIKPF